MNNSFTLATYVKLLKYFQEKYNFYSFKEFDESSSDNAILLRHDIDYSLEHAYEIAKLEASLDIKSSYFLLFSSDFYNILDAKNIELARKIKELGHDVGLHYDVNVMSKAQRQNPNLVFEAQINLLSVLIGADVTTVAMHNPSTSGEDIFKDVDYLNVYHEKFTKDIAYFSDSCMAWRDNFVHNLENDDFPSRFQFLIHPILWSETELGRFEKLNNFKESYIAQVENDIDGVKEIWQNHSGVREHDLREFNRYRN